ncbi:uncharacterized protein BJ171DRAFT_497610 [Polychytrium aggregatum]|uniref:uncharacterized protein n=1 Tax=Polychytrium aggregatum TaxID=110093 RepID=UPI0022FF43B4|nr:uncharacterized protein BJ171DRAFT_497610 [Polychytrium aggregatum]KAI9206387.1 hypothetical protein BJ171DRAFT_497610 [Polychytrium aggregatum]
MERYKTKRQEIQDLQQDLLNLERSLSLVSGEEANRSQAVQAMENKLAILLKEVKEQEAKRDRAYKLLCKLSKELRKAEHTTDATESELDFRTRAAKDIGSLVMGEIGRLSEQYPEVALRFQQLIAEYQIQPPSRVLSRVASRADNIGDDMSMSSGSSSGRRSVADDRGSVKGMSRSSSRSSTGMRLPSRISTSRPSSSGRAIKTMDMNGMVSSRCIVGGWRWQSRMVWIEVRGKAAGSMDRGAGRAGEHAARRQTGKTWRRVGQAILHVARTEAIGGWDVPPPRSCELAGQVGKA